MRLGTTITIVGVWLGAARGVGAQSATDSIHRAVQQQGARVMGVDQSTSSHRFDLLPTGARIVLQRDSVDAQGTAAIRAHLRQLADAFRRGDFSMPAETHGREVPGTATMAARRAVITYRMRNLARGGEVSLTTRDTAALRAINQFVQFQRMDHRAGGMDSTMHRMHHPTPP